MMIVRILLFGLALVALLALGYWAYTVWIQNPRVIRELVENPQGERAGRVMLLTLPGGRGIPVNYLREGDKVFAAADGTWWKDLVGEGTLVTVLIRGETLAGEARVVLDDPVYTKDVFERLRPNALEGFGTLVEITLIRGSAPAAGYFDRRDRRRK